MPAAIAPPPLGSPPPASPEIAPRLAAPPAPLGEAPLLPPVLGGPAVFLWLWVLPIAILFALNLQGYALIEGNMDAAQRSRALWLGVANVANLLAGVALYFGARALAARPAGSVAHLLLRTAPALAIQVGYLWLAALTMEAIPPSVQVWIFPESRFLFNQFSFAMLPLAVGILHLACLPRGPTSGRAVAINLGLAIGAPVLLFVAAHGLRAIWGDFAVPATLVAIVLIVLGMTMFVGLVRALMLGLRRARHGDSKTVEQAAIALFALALPLGGLFLNTTIPFPVDFQAWEVYALTLANAAILLFASARAARSPRLSFGLLCATLPFSLYFFIVFLPYTPLSILAVVVFGAGFLVLSPTLLFALHLHLLNQARHALRAEHGQRSIVATGLACVLLLPAVFVGRATADKLTLNAALDYVYAPSITGADLVYGHDTTELRRALASHRAYKNGIHYPLLTDFYAWWVFNHLVLPDTKLTRLEETFLGGAGAKAGNDPLASRGRNGPGGSSVREQSRMPRPPQLPQAVAVEHLAVQSRAADGGNSVVTMALTLRNPGTVPDEYVKALPLPPGIFVNGFRLHVAGEPVPGRIFEKKSALWVYEMIRDTQRRDPGLVFYKRPDELELRVFPVAAGESTVVEVDFLVPGEVAAAELPAVSRDAANVVAELGRRMRPQLATDTRGGFFSIGREARAGLAAVEREPYLHVIVDRSREHGYTGDLPAALRMLGEKFPAARQARITLANHDVIDLVPDLTPLRDLTARDLAKWQRELAPSGAVALDLALAHSLRRHRDYDLDRPPPGGALPPRPVFVVLSHDAPARKLDLTLTEHWLDLAPEFELHEIAASGTFTTLRKPEITATPLLRQGNSVRPLHPTRPVRFAEASQSATTPNATTVQAWSPTQRTWRAIASTNSQPATTSWSRAASLTLAQQDHARSPGNAGIDLPGLVLASRATGILLGGTSYIVVENAAQWRMLERSEAQKLKQNSALEFREPAASVADTPTPPALYVALAFAGCLAIRHWQQRRGRLADA